MKTKTAPRFDLDALRSVAGETVFARGQDYHRKGQVTILSIEQNRVLARVSGTEDYRTVLTGRGKKIGGECSCPAFEDWGFCKHMVATALAANDGGETAADDAGALSRIRRHLQKKTAGALVEMIIGLAERDTELFRTLELAAATADADDKTLETRLRKAINDATRINGFIEYREAGGWATGVDAVLDTIADLASGKRAALALRLAEHAIDKIEHAIEGIDDSDGHCHGLLQRAAEIHLDAARKARPDPVLLARELFEHELHDGYDVFYNPVSTYAEVLGDAGLAEYRRLASEAWAKLPVRTANARSRDDGMGSYGTLVSILDFFAERDGDLPARIALRRKDLSSPWHYLELANFCHGQGRTEDALRYAEEGLWLFDGGRPDQRLLLFTADLLARSRRRGDAEKLLWRAFEKDPSHELYAHLRKLGGDAAGERILKFLETQKGKPPPWSDQNLLVKILIDEEMFERAWSVVRAGEISMQLRNSLAQASEATHPREALAVYTERVDTLVAGSGYEEAVKLIARMAQLRSPAEHKAYVAALKERNHRKRNLMKLLA